MPRTLLTLSNRHTGQVRPGTPKRSALPFNIGRLEVAADGLAARLTVPSAMSKVVKAWTLIGRPSSPGRPLRCSSVLLMVGTLILTLSIVTIEVVLIGAMALADTIEIACADFIRG